MNTKILMTAVAFGLATVSGAAQGKFGADSVKCVQNLSMTQQFYKQGNYKDAYGPWNECYENCPAAHVSIYQYGPKILGWQIQNETNATTKAQLLDKLMGVYDNRLKYFGNLKKYGKPYILGRKAIDYCTYAPATDSKEKAYEWLNEAIKEGGASNEVGVFHQYFILSDEMYKKNPSAQKLKYIDDYLLITPYLAERGASGVAKDSVYSNIKMIVDVMFARSGAANCADLDGIYKSQIDSKQNDKDFLKMVLALYAIADCDESPVYFKASAYMHKIEPSAKSARGLAVQAYNNKNYSEAIKYFNDAVSMESDNSAKSDLYLKIASVYKLQGNYQQARSFAQKSISMNPGNYKPYLLIGVLYGTYFSSISDDPVIQKTAFWAAVDKLEKAKAVDPSCAANVNKMISSYKNSFPPKTELFMRGIKEGSSYTVPGWIGETTKVR